MQAVDEPNEVAIGVGTDPRSFSLLDLRMATRLRDYLTEWITNQETQERCVHCGATVVRDDITGWITTEQREDRDLCPDNPDSVNHETETQR